MLDRYCRLSLALPAIAALSSAARADIPPPEKQVLSSGLTWVVAIVLVAAIAGIIAYRRKH